MKEEKTKKKFNKKKLLTFGVLGIFALALVAAGVYLYVGSASVMGTVDEPLTVSDATFSFNGFPGTITDNIVIDNLANVDLNVELSWVELSNEANPFSLDNSAGICAWGTPEWNNEDCEKRIIIDELSDFGITTLSDLDTISWDVDVDAGYIAHVDVILDTTGNGEADDALVFEYAKVDPARCEVKPYPIANEIDTFGDSGIVDSSAYAWLSSGNSGPLCVLIDNVDGSGFYTYTLSEWISGPSSNYANVNVIDGNTKVLRLEIEVDNWISQSNSEVSNIVINGNEINVDYELTTTTAIILANTADQNVPVTFTVADDSPVGDFTGVINVRRVD